MSRVTVFLVDDHDILRAGLRFAIESDDTLEVVGEAHAVAPAAEQIALLRPDVVVVDTAMEQGSGIDLCRELRQNGARTRTLVLTAQDAREHLVAALDAGASGYLLKRVRIDTLLSSVHLVANGQSVIDPSLSSRLVDWMSESTSPEPQNPSGLTDQQLRILSLLSEGLTNREIAARLFLAEKTVKNHVTRILAKLGVQRRTQAAVLAWKQSDQ